MKAFLKQFLIVSSLIFFHVSLNAQNPDDRQVIDGPASLEECVEYALKNRPEIRQAQIDQAVTDYTIKSKLADWYPQLNLAYNVQHYMQLPVTILPDLSNPSSGERREVRMGVPNSSTAALSLTQSLFTRDLLLAKSTSRDVRTQSDLLFRSARIATRADVSKAFYDVLLTRQQLSIAEKDIDRLEESLKTAFNQYKGGIVDKTDYKRVTIALNNSRANQERIREMLKAKYAILKHSMGYPPNDMLVVEGEGEIPTEEILIDTTEKVVYDQRVEYQLLHTMRNLRQADLKYQKNSYLPTVSAFLNYNLVFQNQQFSALYGRAFPNSLFGLTLNYPLFQGGKRQYQIRTAELNLTRLDWDFVQLRNAISTEYLQALAQYKANLVQWNTLKENVDLAQEVYDVIQLQYKSGIKTYLDVIISQNDLQNAQFNYIDALYRLVSSKIDVDRSLGKFN